MIAQILGNSVLLQINRHFGIYRLILGLVVFFSSVKIAHVRENLSWANKIFTLEELLTLSGDQILHFSQATHRQWQISVNCYRFTARVNRSLNIIEFVVHCSY